MLPNLNRDTLLKPEAPIGGANVPHLLTNDESLAKMVYMCGSYHRFIADDPRAICPECKYTLSTEVPYVAAQAITEGSSAGGGGGGGFNVKEVGTLEERMVLLGMDEGLKLVKASLESNTALTNVFLGKKQHKLFNFGPLETLSFWGFILVCGLGFLFYYSPY
ncbi:unnamed protein product [Prunus armeniaca]